MKVAVLGSGSRGNAVAIVGPDGALLIDAGFGPRALDRRARAAGIALRPLVGIVVTHEHQDHARGAIALARAARAPIIATPGTLADLDPEAHDVLGLALDQHRPFAVGAFTITASRTNHDAREPVAVVVGDGNGTRVGVAFDVGRPTAAVRYLLRECTLLVLEANHDEVMLRTGPYPASVRQRIASAKGHLSNRAAAELVDELWHPGLRAVVLAHLSERCNRPELARETVLRALRRRGFGGEIHVSAQATPGAVLDLSA